MTKKINYSEIMTKAHKIAKQVREQYVNYKDALSFGLRMSWKAAKDITVQSWFMLKNWTGREIDAYKLGNREVVAETEKAVKIEISFYRKPFYKWVPKSCLA